MMKWLCFPVLGFVLPLAAFGQPVAETGATAEVSVSAPGPAVPASATPPESLPVPGIPDSLRLSAPEESPPAPTVTLQDGDVVEFSGVPIRVDFQSNDVMGVLRFAAATRDLTLPCYEEGTNVWVLRELHSRLERVQSWNSRRLLSGGDPVAVVVRGRFDATHAHLWLDEIRLPRIEEGGLGSVPTWDRFDPDRGDSFPGYAEGRSGSRYAASPPAVRVVEERVVPGSSPPPVSVRSYSPVEYVPPYTYRIQMRPSGGMRAGDAFIYSGPSSGYYWDDYYNAYYPWIYYPYGGNRPPDGGDGTDDGSGEVGGDGAPVSGGDSAISVRQRTESRAERWGRARQIPARMNNPTRND